MRSLAFDLFDKTQKDYNFIMSVRNGCQFILNVNRVQKEGPLALKYCTSKAQKERFDFIKDLTPYAHNKSYLSELLFEFNSIK